jgi:hypothetical protein
MGFETGGDPEPGALVMSSIPLDLERRCEQRWAARFSAARALQEQHRLEGQQHQQLTTPDKSKRKTRIVESAGSTSAATRRPEPAGA